MFTIRPIATVRSPRTTLADDDWGGVESVIELAPDVPEESLEGLEAFSHAEIVFVFHRVAAEKIVTGTRHPRGNPAWPSAGIFAQRGKDRPNRLGTTMVRIVRREGPRLVVRGLDAIDGTPVVDIKPVMAELLPREPVRQPAWASELMREYWEAGNRE
ncbi:MAG TPA: SAM-dependent methyltransferase [Longimicrobium sp.]|nr:SAM-dependent methyltransferase [Longimicrobium sp.]